METVKDNITLCCPYKEYLMIQIDWTEFNPSGWHIEKEGDKEVINFNNIFITDRNNFKGDEYGNLYVPKKFLITHKKCIEG